MSDTATRSPKTRWPFWLAIVVVVVLVLMLAVWVFRIPIASALGQSWCASRSLDCRFELDGLSLGRIDLSDVQVAKVGRPDAFAASSLTANLDGIFPPQIISVDIDKPVLSAEFDGTKLSLGGLETLAQSGQAPPAQSPLIRLTDGAISIETPAGPISGRFFAEGRFPGNGRVTAEIEPAQLRQGADVLEINAASLELELLDGQMVDGTLRVDVAVAEFQAMQLRSGALQATLDRDQSGQIIFQGQAEQFTRRDWFAIDQLDVDGRVALGPRSDMGPEIKAASVNGSALKVTGADSVFHDLKLEVEAEADESEIRITALRLNVAKFASPALITQNLKILASGAVETATGAILARADVVLGKSAVDETVKRAVLSGLAERGPVAGHMTGLRTGLDALMSDFSTGVNVSINAENLSDWRLSVMDKVEMRGQSGTRLVLEPRGPDEAVLSLAPNLVRLASVASLRGPALPVLTADIRDLSVQGGARNLQLGGFDMKPWTVDDLTLGMRLNQVLFSLNEGAALFQTVGEVSVDGRLGGTTLRHGRLFGGLKGRSSSSGWRVETLDQGCLGLDVGGVNLGGTFRLSDLSFPICPDKGRLVRQEAGVSTGRIALGDISLPISGRDITGTARLGAADLVWSAQSGLNLELSAADLAFPLQIGARSLMIESEAPKATLSFSETTKLRTNLGSTKLSGSLVPANLTLRPAEVSGTLSAAGFSGQADKLIVEISDNREDPLYNPLLGTFDLKFDRNGLILSGPVSLAPKGPEIADARLSINLVSLNGEAELRSRKLTFSRGGLQPKALSDLARGLLSNGRGALSAVADFKISGGALTGEGTITAENFGFDTLRIGSIDGINGEIAFSDILSFTTRPDQTIRLGQINPGLTLTNGELSLQIINGKELRLTRAIWPFAGGTLRLDPTTWTIAGTRDIIRVNAEEIELADLVKALSLPDMEAEGTVSGAFPIELSGGNTWIRNARLIADAKGGVLKYTGEAVRQAGSADETVNAAFTALRDFRFSVLEVGIDGNLVDDVTVSVQLLGRNPDVLGGSEFKFNIAIDSKLAELIQSGQDIATSSVVSRTVVDAVRTQDEESP